jgi:hypothetical protein
MIIASVTSVVEAVLEFPLLLLLLLLVLLLPVAVVVVMVELRRSDALKSSNILSKSSSASAFATASFLPWPLLLTPSLPPPFL